MAEFYGNTFGRDAKTSDFDLLVARMEHPSEHPRNSAEYGILGRFAAYLVEHFGLEAVLDVCRITGRYPDGQALCAGMESVLDMTTEELLADFELGLGPSCNLAKSYQSHVLACGAAQAAPDLGLVSVDDEHGIDVTFTLDCANDITVGPLGDKIWITRRFDVDADEFYIAAMHGEGVEIPEVELTLAKCEPCGDVVTIPGAFIGPERLTVGRYSLELRAPADFRGTVNLTIKH